MKFKISNLPCLIYSGTILIGCIVSGLLITTKSRTGSGLAMSITFLLITFGLTLAIFSTLRIEVRKRNLLRIVLLITLFHIVSILSHNGLSGIVILCKTNHPAKIVETCQKTYSTIEIPLVKTMGFSRKVLDEIMQTKEKVGRREKGSLWTNPYKDFFSWNYLILTAGLLICLYKILFSWGRSTFFLAVLTLILTVVYLRFCWNNPWQWKAIWSLIVIAPLGITIYFGKGYQSSPATS